MLSNPFTYRFAPKGVFNFKYLNCLAIACLVRSLLFCIA